MTLISGSYGLLWQVDHGTSGSQKNRNGCWITGLVDHRSINGCWIAQNRVPHAGTVSYHLWQVLRSFFPLAGTITYRLLLVGIEAQFSTCWYDFVPIIAEFAPVDSSCWYEIVPSIAVFSTLWYDFEVIYPNCWNDFRPILATTVRIAGTISYRLSLVQTYTQHFRIIIAGTISYQSLATCLLYTSPSPRD